MDTSQSQQEQSASFMNDGGKNQPNLDLVGHVEVTITAEIGTINLSIEKLFALKEGDVLAMNESLESPVSLILNGKVVATGELLAVDDNFGIRVLQVS